MDKLCFCLPLQYSYHAIFLWTGIYALMLIALSVYVSRIDYLNWFIICYIPINAPILLQFLYLFAVCIKKINLSELANGFLKITVFNILLTGYYWYIWMDSALRWQYCLIFIPVIV